MNSGGMNPGADNGDHEPADLSQLAATDALLDRLGARNATEDDLRDPTVAGLAEMLTLIDEYREPDLGLSQLVEVLDGRPLYLSAADDTVETLRVEHSAEPMAEGGGNLEPRLIDLTEHGRSFVSSLKAGLGGDLEPGDAPGFGDRGGIGGQGGTADQGQVAAFGSKQAAARGWERVLSQVSLPAAAVILLLMLGSGVTAAVTGDPMTALNGVSRVMAQLPGVDHSQRNLDQVQGEINAANAAVLQHNAPAANQHLAAARRGLPDVPAASKTQLGLLINNVQTQLTGNPTSPPAVITPTSPAGVVVTTAPVVATATPSDRPVATTPPVPTATATVDPSPSSVPVTTPVGGGVTQQAGDPTSVPTTSGS